MEILIDRNKKPNFFQAKFRKYFSLLKIEFYYRFLLIGSNVTQNKLLINTFTLKEDAFHTLPNHLSIYSEMTSGKLLSFFADIYKFTVQIFRKAENKWIQKNAMDNLKIITLHYMA